MLERLLSGTSGALLDYAQAGVHISPQVRLRHAEPLLAEIQHGARCNFAAAWQ